MKLIPLSQSKKCKNKALNLFAKIDNCDFKKVSLYNWSIVYAGKSKYATAIINSKRVYLHRFVMQIEDENILLDHEDRDGLNCQRNNIRFSNHSTNGMNIEKRKNLSSKYKGVHWCKRNKMYYAKIRINKKVTHLGCSQSEIDMAKLYDEAAKKYHKEFAVLNFK